MFKKRTKRTASMFAAAAILSTITVPYVAEATDVTTTAIDAEKINITHMFTATEVQAGTYGSVAGSFIENYLKPYFTNAQLVTEDGKKYIELTLIGKAYGVASFEGAEVLSSVGEKLDQVRVIRIPAAGQSTHRVDAGEYGIYDLTFTFGVTDEQLSVTTPAQPVKDTPATENPVNDTVPATKEEPVVTDTAIIEQPATPVTTAPVTERTAVTYTMKADPNGAMADFITNYLSPYFSNAQYVTEGANEYIELTLTGKAYGFAKLQYINTAGQNIDIDVLNTTGEKLDQVRVVRLPLVKDANGVTKIFVDSGDLGYGAYTLFFTFNTPTKEADGTINPFTDIQNVYSKAEILALYKAGITTGTTASTFSPNANITRAQFAVMIARTLNVSSANTPALADIKGKWYVKEVQALAELNIVTGVTPTTFNPGANITRQQAATIIHRVLKHKGYTNKVNTAPSFSDASKISSYALEPIAQLQAEGIMVGSNGAINPTANLTRAQMAKILKNAGDLVNLFN